MKKRKIHLFPEKEDYLNEITKCQELIASFNDSINTFEELHNSWFTSKSKKNWYKEKIETLTYLRDKIIMDLNYNQKKYNQCLANEKRETQI